MERNLFQYLKPKKDFFEKRHSLLLFNLGLRNDELLALKWGDIEQGINGLFVHIQAFAGHSSMKQTMDYIRLDDVDVNLMPFLDALADPAKMETDNVIMFEKPSNTWLCRKLN